MKANVHPFKTIRARGVPLAVFETPDPAQTIAECKKAMNGKIATTAALCWDAVRGLRTLAEPVDGEQHERQCQEALAIIGDGQDPAMLSNCTEAIAALARLAPPETVIFLMNMQRWLSNGAVAQAVWNCRDAFKRSERHCTLILLGPSLELPPELQRDVITVTEELPDQSILADVVDRTAKAAGLSAPEGEFRKRVLDTLLGLSRFEAEQTVALSLTKEGVDLDTLWDKKVKAIEQTPGLTVYRGKETCDDIGGLENAKRQCGRTIGGKLNVSCIVFFDEIDKGMAASGTDSSGTTQDQNKALLSYMQDRNVRGMLWLGPPGTGKTMLAKALANTYRIPLIMVDLGAMKGSLVGQSEQNMRAALRVIHAVSDGRALFVGACNRTETLPPELRRRFNYTSMFFDLPDQAERATIWKVKKAKYQIQGAQDDAVNDDGWTGAEIENACLKSWAMECPLSESARTIVPISRSAGQLVTALRNSANGNYISASQDGIYQMRLTTTAATTTDRKFEL